MRAKRRAAIVAVLAGLLSLGREAFAQSVRPPRRVGVLFSGSREQYYEDFKQELRLRGYVEDRTLVLLPKYAGGDLTRLPGMADEILKWKPDVVVTSSTAATAAMKRAGSPLPIVMATSADPVRSGFVASLDHPGGNITGMASLGVGLSVRTLELMHAALPKVEHVGVLLTKASAYDPQMPNVLDAAKRLGVKITTLRANTEAELEQVFTGLADQGIGALVVFGDAVFVALRRKLAALANRVKVPVIYQWRSHAEAGGLMSYGPKISQGWKSAARYVDRILKGADPSITPVEQVVIFEFVVNTATARRLNLAIPKPVLARADSLVE